jgi:hypothetical protein
VIGSDGTSWRKTRSGCQISLEQVVRENGERVHADEAGERRAIALPTLLRRPVLAAPSTITRWVPSNGGGLPIFAKIASVL